MDASDIIDPTNRRAAAAARRRLYDLSHPSSIEDQVVSDGDVTFGDLHLAAIDDELDHVIDEIAVREILDKALRTSGLASHVVANEKLGVRGGDGSFTLEEIARILYRKGLTNNEVSRQRIGQIWDEARDRIGTEMGR